MAVLPGEVWGFASYWLLPREFVRLSWCKPNFYELARMQGLWHYFCHLAGYTQFGDVHWDAEHAAASLLMPLETKGLMTALDWRLIFQMNANAGAIRGNSFIWISVNGEEVRLASGNVECCDTEDAVLQGTWLREHGWRSPGVLQQVLQQVLLASSPRMPLRLRELMMGRPGFCIKGAQFLVEECPASALVEWPLSRQPEGGWNWVLPPHYTGGDPELESPQASQLRAWLAGCLPGYQAFRRQPEVHAVHEVVDEGWQDGSTGGLPQDGGPSFHPRPHPWSRSGGMLVELVAAPPPEVLLQFSRSSSWPSSQAAPRSKWIVIGEQQSAGSLTLKSLCRGLAPHLSELALPSSCLISLADTGKPWQPAEWAEPQLLLIKNLHWTQAERLYVYEVPRSLRYAASRYCPTVEHDSVVLFSRASARPPRRAPGRMPCEVLEQHGAAMSAFPHAACTSSGYRQGCTPLQDQPMPDDSGGGGGSPRSSPSRGAARTGPVIPPFLSNASEVPLDQLLPHSRRLLLSSAGVRQFEFHPVRSTCMLAGRKDGVVTVLDCEADKLTHSVEIDSYPILALSWLHSHPQWAVVGASPSGSIAFVRYDDTRPGYLGQIQLEPFRQLSSLSVNCTDDYFMTSGFSVDVGLYDVVTKQRLSTFRGMHQNYINILRFAHRSPHLFATASFDHTCKVWDLRGPVSAQRPVQNFPTNTLNVMCTFSPDDRYVLCSGVDEALQQFGLRETSTASHFPLPSLGSDTNYRRALYLAGGNFVGTAATNESLLRIYTADSPHRHMGHVDFRSMLRHRNRPSKSQQAYMDYDRTQRYRGSGRALPEADVREEFVQSLRCHPQDPRTLAALLSTSDQHAATYVSTVKLGEVDASAAGEGRASSMNSL